VQCIYRLGRLAILIDQKERPPEIFDLIFNAGIVKQHAYVEKQPPLHDANDGSEVIGPCARSQQPLNCRPKFSAGFIWVF